MKSRSPDLPGSPPDSSLGSSLRRLVFQWPQRRISFAFPLVFIAVVLLHAVTFYGFQVVYPPVATVPPLPGEVTLISPGTPANAALLEWIDAQNPALAPRLQEQEPTGLGEIRYVPTYTTLQTRPKPAEQPRLATVFPPAYTPAQLLSPGSFAGERGVKEAAGPVRTSLIYSGELQARARGEALPASSGSPDSSSLPAPIGLPEGNLQPVVCLIAVSPHGRVLHTFLQQSSGNTAMDRLAERTIERQVFSPQQGETQWGLATLIWGMSEMPGTPAEGMP